MSPAKEETSMPHPDALTISTDPSRLDVDVIHGFLAGSYWAAGIPRETVERAVRHSLCFGAYEDGRQVGFARVISDRATFAYVSDVFVLPSHRGRGVGTRLMSAILAHPELQGLRRWTLFTRDAHALYRKVGFGESAHPERLMEIVSPPYPAAAAPAAAGAAR
jgi:GNAT superfamily N-acetyltransferase